MYFNSMNECQFCTDLYFISKRTVPILNYFNRDTNKKLSPIKQIHRSLYFKYSSSQNYHYTKEINSILTKRRSHVGIKYIDDLCFNENSQQFLNKFLPLNDSLDKMLMLGEYYKFHNDIPRLFMLPEIVTLNWFHDKKRRLEYLRIARLIQDDNRNNPNQPPKGIVGDSPLIVQESESMTQNQEDSSEILSINNKKKILDEVSWLRNEYSQVSQCSQLKISTIQTKDQFKKQIKKLKFYDNPITLHNIKQISSQIEVRSNNLEQCRSNQEITNKIIDSKQNKWKRNFKLDEHILRKQQDEYQIHPSKQRNDDSSKLSNIQINPPVSARQPKTPKCDKLQQLKRRRTSLSNILQIVKLKTCVGYGKKSQHIYTQDFKSQEPLTEITHQSKVHLTKNKEQCINKRIQYKQEKISALLSPQYLIQSIKNKNTYSKLQTNQVQSMDLKNKSSQKIQGHSLIVAKNNLSNLGVSVTPRTNGPFQPSSVGSIKGLFNQKLEMLEQRVLSDLVRLQYQRKKNSSMEIERLKHQIKSSLTQRELTPECPKNKLRCQGKKLNINEINTFKQSQFLQKHSTTNCDYMKVQLSGTQSQRDKGNKFTKVEYLLQNNLQPQKKQSQINISNEQSKQRAKYYNNIPFTSPSQPSQVSTFVTQNHSSLNQNTSIKQITQVLPLSTSLDKWQKQHLKNIRLLQSKLEKEGQIKKYSLNTSQKLQEYIPSPKLQEYIPSPKAYISITKNNKPTIQQQIQKTVGSPSANKIPDTHFSSRNIKQSYQSKVIHQH